MRATTLRVTTALGLSLGLWGCGERDPYNAYDVASANQFQAEQRAQAMKRAPADPDMFTVSEPAKIRCKCDGEGGLHVTAPADAQVRPMTNGDREDAEAEISLAERPAGTRIRRTVSLGYVGDGPLTQVPSRGGPWNVPDAVLPIHQHTEPHYPPVMTYGAPFYGYGGYVRGGYGGYGYGGYGGGSSAGGSQPQPRSRMYFPTHVHTPGSSISPGPSRTSPPSNPRGPR